MNRELSFVLNFGAVRSHERIYNPGKSNFSHVTGGLITAIIPVRVQKVSLIVLISKSDKKEEHFQVYFDRSILPDGVR